MYIHFLVANFTLTMAYGVLLCASWVKNMALIWTMLIMILPLFYRCQAILVGIARCQAVMLSIL